MLFFTSDTHFSDRRVLGIDNRPYGTLQEHDDGLIANWNATVGPDDEVWHLGDFARGTPDAIDRLLACLNGRKHLIIGNNDGPATVASPHWASTQHYAELEVDGKFLVLCHYAFRTWNRMGKGAFNLHGHSHGRLKPLPRQRDVGVDAQDYRPVAATSLLISRSRGGGSIEAKSPLNG